MFPKKIDHKQPKKTALITGAAAGIGYELASIFARDGYNLVLVDKNEQQLANVTNELKSKFGSLITMITKDLSLPTSSLEIYSQLQAASINVDFLVNNAGFGHYGFFADTDLTSELDMLQVNLVTLTHMTKLFVRDMAKRGQGKVLNVASTAAFQPGPLMAVYFATKAYVLSFSQAIANELEGTGVTVTVLCPGPTESAFHVTTGMAETELVKGKKMMDAATVARVGYRGLMANKTVVIPGVKNRILAETVRFIPRSLVTKFVRNMQELPSIDEGASI
ncbi:SDR family oxidoreductase [Calothrix sp. UHCC 0171]|uniref:SDR family NAD(P)-dependent oxidoreductase n=1 Tax=Calothrix sp. UHCC 0171 TaxID=3110245 RepID=UPI002B20D30C|nr:SDR family oxidoreductase [Calothrix sp. UHCC 0171]MEA5572297.1 SDR family oxidoreductase [Calothrix sp. UHCC 0171]